MTFETSRDAEVAADKNVSAPPRLRLRCPVTFAIFEQGLPSGFSAGESGFYPSHFAAKSGQGRLVFSNLHNTLLI